MHSLNRNLITPSSWEEADFRRMQLTLIKFSPVVINIKTERQCLVGLFLFSKILWYIECNYHQATENLKTMSFQT
jgi:hypothetical protein